MLHTATGNCTNNLLLKMCSKQLLDSKATHHSCVHIILLTKLFIFFSAFSRAGTDAAFRANVAAGASYHERDPLSVMRAGAAGGGRGGGGHSAVGL